MRKEHRSMIGFYTIGIVALFIAGFMLLVVYGAHTYRDTVQSQNANSEMRSVFAYLQASVQGHGEDDIRVEQDPAAGTVLVIPESGTAFGQRIYLYEGQLINDYSRLDRELRPAEAQVLGPAEFFEITEGDGGLITIRTDAGQVLLHLGRKGGA
ncbi:MAG: DUF4860 domain-containing protein [Mogibacterium sp.]|nr:DUF4860 domain-containing protein [Mogibacterium sp.]